MPHKRSLEARKRRTLNSLYKAAFKHICEHAYRDIFWAETVCRTDKVSVVNYLRVHYTDEIEYLNLDEVPETSELWPIPKTAEKGLILSDSRGRGALQ